MLDFTFELQFLLEANLQAVESQLGCFFRSRRQSINRDVPSSKTDPLTANKIQLGIQLYSRQWF